MATTIEELERRVLVLEESRPADLRRAVTRIAEIVEETRLRVSAVEHQLEDIRKHMFEATAETAKMRGELRAEISAVRNELKADIYEVKADLRGLRSDLPTMLVEAVREGLKGR